MSLTKNQVTTGVRTRLSFVHLDEPWSFEKGQEGKYSVTVMIPKDDEETLRKIKAAIAYVLTTDRARENLKGVKGDITFLRDGDEKLDDPNFAGYYYFNCKTNIKNPPTLVDRKRIRITENIHQEFYSGVYACVCFSIFSYNKSGKKGLTTALLAVQKVKDGDSFGGFAPVNVDNAFQELPDEDDDDFLA